MLAKSRKSAWVMTCLFILTTLVVTVAMSRWINPQNPVTRENTSSGADGGVLGVVVLCVVVIFVVGFALAIGSYGIYQFDDTHFGLKGALRWAALGAFCALSVQVALILVPRAESLWQAALYKGLRTGLEFLMFALSYCLVFWRIPFARGRPTPRAGGPEGEPTPPGQLKMQAPVNIGEVLARIRQNQEAKRSFLAISWFLIGGGLLVLMINLTMPAHPNPYLSLTLIGMGLSGVVLGGEMLLFLRQSRLAPWLMLIDSILFLASLGLLLLTFTYSP